MQQPRIVTWRAVSTEEQADKESLDYQRDLNRQHVARWDGVVIADLEVPGLSRNIILWQDACERIPAFAELNELLKRKAFDILMCQDVTRLGRTSALVATLAALCEQAGVRVYETTSPPASLDGPAGTSDSRLLMLFKGHQSESEVRKFSERASFGRQAQARKGKHANTPPVGLKRVYRMNGEDVESVTVIDEEWRPIIELFFDLYVEHGRSQFKIVQEFNDRGYLTPLSKQPWDVKTIRVFLRNRWAYAGYVTWGAWSKTPEKAFRTKAEWPAIISEETARAAERGMKERAGAPKAAGRPHRFSLMARCNLCNSTMSVIGNGGRKSCKTTAYLCRRRCRHAFIREPILYEAVHDAITTLQNKAKMELLVGETPQAHIDLVALLHEAQQALESVRKERTKLTHAYMRDTITIDEYEPLMADLKARHDDIARTVTELDNQIAATPTAEQRRQRLAEIRDRGLEMLDHPDVITANNWLRQHFVMLVQDHEVKKVFLY